MFLGSFAVHVAIKLPVALKRREHEPDVLAAARPGPVTISRRGLLAFTGAGAGLVLVGNAGQSLGGPFRKLALPGAAARRRLPRQQDDAGRRHQAGMPSARPGG